MTDPSIGSLLFEYRFAGRGELAGHNLGNLMLLALDNLCVRPLDAIKLISDMLKIESQLLPMSEFPTDLCAHTACGNQILGKSPSISSTPRRSPQPEPGGTGHPRGGAGIGSGRHDHPRPRQLSYLHHAAPAAG